MSRMRCLTISDADTDGEDSAEPLLVVQVDGAMIRRVLALIVDHLAADAPPAPRPVLLHRRDTPDADA